MENIIKEESLLVQTSTIDKQFILFSKIFLWIFGLVLIPWFLLVVLIILISAVGATLWFIPADITFSILLYPACFFVSLYFSRKFVSIHKFKLAFFASLLPLVSVVLFFYIIQIYL